MGSIYELFIGLFYRTNMPIVYKYINQFKQVNLNKSLAYFPSSTQNTSFNNLRLKGGKTMKKLFLSMLMFGFVGFLMLAIGCTHPELSQNAMTSESSMQAETEKMMKEEASMKKEGDTMMKEETSMEKQ